MTYTIDFSTMKEMSLAPETEEEETLQNLYCMLNTAINEVPCYREFGIDQSFIHAPMNISKTMLVAAIAEAMGQFFPELRLENVDFEYDDDNSDFAGCYIEETDNE